MTIENAYIKLTGVRRGFIEGGRRREVLTGLDLSIAEGEQLALVGRSGSGKSTLLNIVGGIDAPDTGSVRIDGQDITTLDERRRTLFRRRHIGFVYQFFNLLPTLTVEENLMLPLELNGLEHGPLRESALALLADIGLGDRRRSFPDALSGGEQQRLAIARALVHQPSVVLADEPTGNLDADTAQQVLAILNRLVRESGKTLLMVTHSLEIARTLDRTVGLEDGRIHDDTRIAAN